MILEVYVRRVCGVCEGDGLDPQTRLPCERCSGSGKETAWISLPELTSHVTVEQVRRGRGQK